MLTCHRLTWACGAWATSCDCSWRSLSTSVSQTWRPKFFWSPWSTRTWLSTTPPVASHDHTCNSGYQRTLCPQCVAIPGWRSATRNSEQNEGGQNAHEDEEDEGEENHYVDKDEDLGEWRWGKCRWRRGGRPWGKWQWIEWHGWVPTTQDLNCEPSDSDYGQRTRIIQVAVACETNSVKTKWFALWLW